MQNLLKQHIEERLGIDIQGLDQVLEHFIEVSTKRNQILLQQGELCKYVYFIAKGCLQVFVYDAASNETTRDIVTEGNWCSDLTSFGSGQPANEYIRTVEPCTLFAIDRAGFQKMMETVPQFEKVYRQILEASYANSVYRINTFVSMTALDRANF